MYSDVISLAIGSRSLEWKMDRRVVRAADRNREGQSAANVWKGQSVTNLMMVNCQEKEESKDISSPPTWCERVRRSD
jgi:hypothetical protein